MMPLGNTTSKLAGFASKSHLTGISSACCVLGVCPENCVGTQDWWDVVGQWDKCQLCHARSILYSPKPAQPPAQKHFKILTSILLGGWSRAPPLIDGFLFSTSGLSSFFIHLVFANMVLSFQLLGFFPWCSLFETFIHQVPHFLSIQAALLHKQRIFPSLHPTGSPVLWITPLALFFTSSAWQ